MGYIVPLKMKDDYCNLNSLHFKLLIALIITERMGEDEYS